MQMTNLWTNTEELTYYIFNKLINNKRFNEQYLLIQSTSSTISNVLIEFLI